LWCCAPISGLGVEDLVRPVRPFFRYRRDLKARSRELRHDPTPAERRLWFDFLSTHPKKFTRQKPLARYIADFYCAQARLVVEVDGDSHFSGAGEQHDGRRTEELALLGIRVIRFDNLEVMQQFEGVCARIDEALAD
jgi:very-short-patch-repair endonuclease